MPFVTPTKEESSRWPQPCTDREHNPLSHMVIPNGAVWECPSCHKRMVIHTATFGL